MYAEGSTESFLEGSLNTKQDVYRGASWAASLQERARLVERTPASVTGGLAPCTPAGRLQLEPSESQVDYCSWLPDERRAASGFVLAELRPYREAPQQADVIATM